MEASREVRKKLAVVIGNLICRCIEEARYVPYILGQDEVIEMIVRNPEAFQKLVQEEQCDRTEYSTGTLTAKLDALAELGQFESFDGFDMSFCSRNESEANLAPAIEKINHLTRTFNVYVGNTVTLFEKEFEAFTEKFREQLSRAGMDLRVIGFTTEDMADLEKTALSYQDSGQMLQAFMFERLLSCHVITKQFVSLPEGYSLGERLIENAVRSPALFPATVKFIMRVSYVSQGGWEDLFTLLVRIVDFEADESCRSRLIDLLEQDAMFSCNLLCAGFADLKRRTPLERRAAIDRSLQAWKQKGCA